MLSSDQNTLDGTHSQHSQHSTSQDDLADIEEGNQCPAAVQLADAQVLLTYPSTFKLQNPNSYWIQFAFKFNAFSVLIFRLFSSLCLATLASRLKTLPLLVTRCILGSICLFLATSSVSEPILLTRTPRKNARTKSPGGKSLST